MIFIALLFLMSSCHEDDKIMPENLNVLPPITMEGLNTYGCYINGELFLPKKNSLNPSTFPIIANYDEDCTGNLCGFYLTGTRDVVEPRDFRKLEISFFDLKEEGIYSRENGCFAKANAKCRMVNFIGNSGDHYIDTTQNHIIDITKLDTKNNIASGTFEFVLINERDITDTLRITDGRFDAVYFR